jgi:hypothetical protein
MQFIYGDSAVGYIPAQVDSTVIYYYISATSNSGRTVTKPLVAPDGFYKFMVENSVTSISESSQPGEFYLSQNYPNPFNPSTSLQYAIGNQQFVTLKVFDLLGREVASLVNEEKPAGSYEINFNASELPSGVYFYQLQAGAFLETKKMLLLK